MVKSKFIPLVSGLAAIVTFAACPLFFGGCSAQSIALSGNNTNGSTALQATTVYTLEIDNMSFSGGDHLVKVLPVSSAENPQAGVAHVEYAVPIEMTQKYGFSVTTKEAEITLSCAKNYEFRGGSSLITVYADINEIDIDGGVTVTAEVTAMTEFEIDIDGAANLTVTGINATKTDVSIDGAANVTLSGTTDSAKIDVDGAANVTAKDLIARTAEVDIDGAGNVKISCSESLFGKIDGMGNIIYYGNPTVQKTINGLGTISAG